MNIPTEYQLLIGFAIGMLILTLVKWVKDYRKNKDKEPQRLAFISIILALLIIVPFISVIGFILAIISLRIKTNKRLSKVALVLNIIAMLPWFAVLIFGP